MRYSSRMITVELNRHYKENEVTLQCGEAIYATLREDGGLQRALTEQVENRMAIVRYWGVTGKRNKNNTVFHAYMDEGIIRLSFYKKRTTFLTYEEAYFVACKLLDTPGIANVQINEHMERQEIKKGLDFGNTTD